MPYSAFSNNQHHVWFLDKKRANRELTETGHLLRISYAVNLEHFPMGHPTPKLDTTLLDLWPNKLTQCDQQQHTTKAEIHLLPFLISCSYLVHVWVNVYAILQLNLQRRMGHVARSIAEPGLDQQAMWSKRRRECRVKTGSFSKSLTDDSKLKNKWASLASGAKLSRLGAGLGCRRERIRARETGGEGRRK